MRTTFAFFGLSSLTLPADPLADVLLSRVLVESAGDELCGLAGLYPPILVASDFFSGRIPMFEGMSFRSARWAA